ncbi:MAG TPA: PaaI family thioesterase [Thermoleophilaceae bacterium]|nr:PaaI family thioesterase [Thermoleophilaceae bacterium]
MEPLLPPHHPNCLGCGDENPASMGLRLRRDGDRVRGEVTLDRRHEGAPGFAHGGAVATILDDALGSVLALVRVPAVTAKLEVNYRRPAFLGLRFEVEAWVSSREDRKRRLAGELREGGEPVADAAGLFIQVEVEHFLQGARELPETWRRPARETGGPELPW